MTQAFNDPHMISDEALDARYTDQETLDRLFACEHTGQMMRGIWDKILSTTPDQQRPFLTAMKAGTYRKTDEYRQTEFKARMQAKRRYGHRSYR